MVAVFLQRLDHFQNPFITLAENNVTQDPIHTTNITLAHFQRLCLWLLSLSLNSFKCPTQLPGTAIPGMMVEFSTQC